MHTATATPVAFDAVRIGDALVWAVTDRSANYIEQRNVRGIVTEVTANTVRLGTRRLTRAGWYAAGVQRESARA